MNEAGISIPWWGWLALIAALVACAIVAKIARDIRATKKHHRRTHQEHPAGRG